MNPFGYFNPHPLCDFIVNRRGNILIIDSKQTFKIRWLNLNQFNYINENNWENYANQTTPSEIKQGFWTTENLKNFTIAFWQNQKILKNAGANTLEWCGCLIGPNVASCPICIMQIEYYEIKELMDTAENYIIHKLQLVDSVIYIQRLYRSKGAALPL